MQTCLSRRCDSWQHNLDQRKEAGAHYRDGSPILSFEAIQTPAISGWSFFRHAKPAGRPALPTELSSLDWIQFRTEKPVIKLQSIFTTAATGETRSVVN
jgi:hypothetical protein